MVMIFSDCVDVLNDSFCFKGNNSRLKNILDKKTEICVAFSGGSITKGWNGSGYIEKNYPFYVCEYFSKKYPEKVFSREILSTESANSFIGLSVISKKEKEIMPDIVFVEYAVNNECSNEHIVAFESLVHHFLKLPSEPAVILVLNINQAFYSCQGYMKTIGKHYDLLTVSIADTLKKQITENGFLWSDYSGDNIHPNEDGQKFIADCVCYCIDQSLLAENDRAYSVPSPKFSVDYSRYKAVGADDRNLKHELFHKENGSEFFENCLVTTGEKGEAIIRFKADFKHLFITYMHDKTERFSDADVYIDGRKSSVLQGKSIYGWGNAVLKHVYEFNKKESHIVEIKVKDRKKEFIFFEFGIC